MDNYSYADSPTSTDEDASANHIGPELAPLLEDIAALIGRYVVLTPAQKHAIGVWVFHTHVIEAAEATPYLQIWSPEKRSGKSRLLEVLEVLVARPIATINISEAALFRAIEDRQPTLLFDEYDAIFGAKARDREDLRALLNAGHRRGAQIHRVVGDGHQLQTRAFPVFCAKALAGIGKLPDTVADRCISIALRRKARHEHVERLRSREIREEATALHARIEEVALQVIETLTDARPDLPDELDDRAADGWEPLLAIADLAGGEWPARARNAALELSAGVAREDESGGVQLLADIRRVFTEQQADRFSTTELIRHLASDEESAWNSWWDDKEHAPSRGAPRALAQLLRNFGITSRTLRFTDHSQAKGYERGQFEDDWNRYLSSQEGANPYQPSHDDHVQPSVGRPAPSDPAAQPAFASRPTPRGEELLRLLKKYRPHLIGRHDLLTLKEMRSIAALYSQFEQSNGANTADTDDDTEAA